MDMQEAQNKLEQSFALMGNDLGYIKRDIAEIKTTLKDLGTTFVTRPEHIEILKVQEDHKKTIKDLSDLTQGLPMIKNLVFGGTAVILTSVLSAVLYLVVK